MATTAITINVDNSILASAIAALNWKSGYQTQIPGPGDTGQMIPNPVTPAQAAKAQIITYVENCMIDYANMQSSQTNTAPAASLFS
jgi:hypothetical protein